VHLDGISHVQSKNPPSITGIQFSLQEKQQQAFEEEMVMMISFWCSLSLALHFPQQEIVCHILSYAQQSRMRSQSHGKGQD
jgi:hypothetical protein